MKHSYPHCLWWLPCVGWPAVLLALLAGASPPARAGGPLQVDANGQPYRWDTSQPIRYSVSPGPLGSRSHDWAVAAVDQAVRTWEGVPSAVIGFEAAGELSRPVTGSSVMSFLQRLGGDSPCPILFDSDGSITQALLGKGAIEAGFDEPLLEQPDEDRYVLSLVVLDGPGLAEYGDSRVEKVIVHELGHLLGLDHSQLNVEQLYDGDPTNDALAPVMSYFRGPNGDGSLHRDDQAWVSWLYPATDFAAGTGTIRGRVLLPDGMTGLRGIDVIARRAGDPKVTAVSSVSGYLFGGVSGGARDPARLGEFFIPGLRPGSYTLELQQLEDMPVVRVPAAYLPGGPKFWHEGSSAQDRSTDSTPIVVSAGQDVKGIDIVVNAGDLGPPRPVTAQYPNALPNAQKVTLPAVISGQIDDAPSAGTGATAGPAIDPSNPAGELQDVYQAILHDWTTVTAILSTANRAADLDLYVLDKPAAKYVIEGSSTLPGTLPDVVQLRLAPGRYYFGVHRASAHGSAYTLQLLATPSPPPDTPPPTIWLNYLLLGGVTTDAAALSWQTTDVTTSVVYYNQPLREVGSPPLQQDHALTLTGLTAGQRTPVQVYVPSPGYPTQPGIATATVTPATSPAPDGVPQIVSTSSARLLGLDYFAQATVQLANAGDGDAGQVRITDVTLAPGWDILEDYLTGQPLPDTLDLGGIGAGGAGAFVVWIIRGSGNAAPSITAHGSYTDAAGTVRQF